jgi:ABC-type lipoprotein export system ATPase subunit
MDEVAPLVRIRDLAYSYPGGPEILRIPALDVSGRGLIAITGPSGAGKSTFVELLAGTLQSGYQGSVEVLGSEWGDLRRDADRQRHLRRIGFIPQDFGLLPDRTPRQMLQQDLTDSGVPPEEYTGRIERALSEVDMGDLADQRIASLSGGQGQRVAIARMLARDVDLVIADEPTANLDPGLRGVVLGLLRKLSERVPVIVVTHDPAVAEACDRTIILQPAPPRFDEQRPVNRMRPRRTPAVIGGLLVLAALAIVAGLFASGALDSRHTGSAESASLLAKQRLALSLYVRRNEAAKNPVNSSVMSSVLLTARGPTAVVTYATRPFTEAGADTEAPIVRVLSWRDGKWAPVATFPVARGWAFAPGYLTAFDLAHGAISYVVFGAQGAGDSTPAMVLSNFGGAWHPIVFETPQGPVSDIPSPLIGHEGQVTWRSIGDAGRCEQTTPYRFDQTRGVFVVAGATRNTCSKGGATTQTVTASVPVVACPTTWGITPGPAPKTLPSSITLSLPPSLVGEVTDYSDQMKIMQVIGPKDWQCAASYGADGGGGLQVYSPNEEAPSGSAFSNQSAEAVEGHETSVGLLNRLEQACPLFPSAAVALESEYQLSCSETKPAEEQSTQLSSTVVEFEDPPGVVGDGDPSGGPYPANGVMIYIPGSDNGSWTETCTLPASEHSLCTLSLNQFVSSYASF